MTLRGEIHLTDQFLLAGDKQREDMFNKMLLLIMVLSSPLPR